MIQNGCEHVLLTLSFCRALSPLHQAKGCALFDHTSTVVYAIRRELYSWRAEFAEMSLDVFVAFLHNVQVLYSTWYCTYTGCTPTSHN